MSQHSLVKRLIAFLKRPDALEHDGREPVRNEYDDYEPKYTQQHSDESQHDSAITYVQRAAQGPLVNSNRQAPHHASRLDALVVRALQQFSAQEGYIIRYTHGRPMDYCTGRDLRGRFIPHTEAVLDRHAVFQALDSGEAQLLVHTPDGSTQVAVLCGPLWDNDELIGVLYLENPARSRLHRGIFDVFCSQAARMLTQGIA